MVRVLLFIFLCSISFVVQANERIISLAPDLTEILFAIGAGNRVVGVIQGSDYPAEVKHLPTVGRYQHVDIEKIVSLHPDLIVTYASDKEINQLKKVGVPIYVAHLSRLLDIPHTMQQLGRIVGVTESANQAASEFLERYNGLQQKYARAKPQTVFFQVWDKPLMTVGQSSWINDMLTVCHRKPVISNLKGEAPVVSEEAVVAAKPDIILGERVNRWQQWGFKTITINPDSIERATPRVLDGIETICA